MIDPIAARQFAVEVVSRLRQAGHEALWAGGCVRDQLMGRQPEDYDVATSARPEQTRACFGRRRTLAIGAAFGVITVLGTRRSGQIDVATFRRDQTYSDGRHPDSVTFSSAEEDARRRDFTVNGLFFDPLTGRTIDFVGGQEDIQHKLIRAIGNPADRIAEDKLRMLRAVRFAATLEFELHAATAAAVCQHARELTVVSAERVAAEMRRMLVHRERARAVRLLQVCRLLEVVLPESSRFFPGGSPAQEESSPWHRTLGILARLEKPTFPVALAALLVQLGQPDQTVEAKEICERWRISRDETNRVAWMLKHQELIRAANKIPWPRLQRVLISNWVEELLALSQAVAEVIDGSAWEIQFCRGMLAQPPEQLNPAPLITGADLRILGVPAGPIYSQLLERIRDAQLEKKIATADEARQLARQLWLQSGT